MRCMAYPAVAVAVCVTTVLGLTPSINAKPASFPDSTPTRYNLAVDGALPFNEPDPFPEGADVIAMAWHLDQGRMIDAFGHRVTSGPWQIAAERMAKLPTGRVQLQLMTRGTGEFAINKRTINIVDEPPQPPGIAFDDQAANAITKGEEQTIGFDVTGDVPAKADVLTLAWSQAQQRIVDDYAHTLDTSANALNSTKFDALPTGRVQLQLLLRVDDRTLDIAKRWFEVKAAPEPEPQVAVEFADDAPTRVQLGSEPSIPFSVTGTLPESGDVLVLAWSQSQSRMVQAFVHGQRAKPWAVQPAKLETLPEGRTQLQLLVREDRQAAQSAVLDRDTLWVDVIGKPDPDPPSDPDSTIGDITGVSGGELVQGQVTIGADVKGNPQRVAFTLFHEGENVRDSVATRQPYAFPGGDKQWDTSEAAPGQYTMRVDVYDALRGKPVDTRSIRFKVADQSSGSGPGEVKAPKQGWTQFDPNQAERIIFVSSSRGDDSNNGRSPNQAVRSVARGKSMLRDGHADWLLLKRGDVFREGLGGWQMGGASSNRPMLIGAYGSGPRPELQPQGADFMNVGGSPRHLVLVNIHAHATKRDPSHPDFTGGYDKANGVFWYGGGGDVHFENCLFEYFNNNIALQSRSNDNRIDGVTLYRCVLRYSYTIGDQGRAQQGLFGTRLNNVTLRENVFYHNGWSERVPGTWRSMFGHNVYLNGTQNLTVEDNIVAFGSFNGLNLRTGNKDGDSQRNVVARGNLVVGNAQGITSRANDNRYTISSDLLIENNVVTQHGGRIPVGSNEILVASGITLSNWDGARVRDNLVMRSPQGSGGGALKVQTYNRPNSRNVTFTQNVVHQWGDNRLELSSPGVNVFDNQIGLAKDRFFDPTRTLDRYIRRRTNTGSVRAFFEKASRMRKGNWDKTYTAKPVVRFLQKGFDVK
jgi:hypothetical protein